MILMLIPVITVQVVGSGIARVSGPQSGLLTALIGYLNVLLEYFDFFKFSLARHNQHLGGPGPCLASPWLRPW